MRDLQFKLLEWALLRLAALDRELRERRYEYSPGTSDRFPALFELGDATLRHFATLLKKYSGPLTAELPSAQVSVSPFVRAYGTTRKVGGHRSPS